MNSGAFFPVTFPIWYDNSLLVSRPSPYGFAPRLFAHAYSPQQRSRRRKVLDLPGWRFFFIGWILCLLLQKDKTLRKDTAPGRVAWLVGFGRAIIPLRGPRRDEITSRRSCRHPFLGPIHGAVWPYKQASRRRCRNRWIVVGTVLLFGHNI